MRRCLLFLIGLALLGGGAARTAPPRAPEFIPGQYIVLVKNETAFAARYGSSIPIAGVYSGNLSNSGERIIPVDGSGQTRGGRR